MLYEIAVTRVEQKTMLIVIESDTLDMALSRAEKISSESDFSEIEIDGVDFTTEVISECKF